MTIAPESLTRHKPVTVRFTAAGVPLAVRYDGQVWAVAEEPLRWYERGNWWETQRRAPAGAAVVDVLVWQVQVRLTSTSLLQTMELRQLPMTKEWLLASINGAD